MQRQTGGQHRLIYHRYTLYYTVIKNNCELSKANAKVLVDSIEHNIKELVTRLLRC